jgi:integrase/recombinase XerC
MVENFETYLLKEKRYSHHTVVAYINDIRSFCESSGIDEAQLHVWKEVNYQLVRTWMVELLDSGLVSRTVNRKLSSLRTFFKWLESNGVIDVSPMSKVKGPKTAKRLPEFVQETELTEDKINSLFTDDYPGFRDKLLLEILYQTGIRLSECISIKQTDFSNQQLKVLGKRNKERIITISEALQFSLEELTRLNVQNEFYSDYVFLTDKGEKMYPKFVYRKINNYLSCVTSLKKQSPHVLRHTFATHLLNNGVNIEVLKEILGHASLAATQVYTHNSFAKINEIYKSAHPREQKKK